MTPRLDIQGLRAAAVLMIVAYHTGLPLPGGFTGVDVFFVISGFVIAGTLTGELSSTGQVSLRDFYARRIKRLLPAPAVMLVLVAIIGIVADPVGAQHMAAMTGIAAALSGSNFYLDHLPTGYFDVSMELNPLLHTWMLAVIVQLYLVFPLLLVVGWWLGRSKLARGNSRGMAWALVALITVMSFLLSYSLSRGYLPSGSQNHERLAFYSSPTRAWEFGVGALIVLTTPLISRLPAWSTQVMGMAGALSLGVSAFSIQDVGFRETKVLLPVLAACLLVAAGIGSKGGISQLLGLRPLVWLGDISFSLYLWHWPMIVFARALYPYHPTRTAAAAALLSFLPAWLSYRYVERPIRFSPRLSARRPRARRAVIAVATICVLVPIGANIGLLGAHRALGGNSKLEAWRKAEELHADIPRGCENFTPFGERSDPDCTWKIPRSRGEVVLFGDSQAGQLTEPVAQAGNRAGYDVTVVTAASCPFVGLRLKTVLGEDPRCPRFAAETLTTLVHARPSLVIVSARTDSYVNNPDDGLGIIGSTDLVFGTQEKALLWQRTLESVLQRLNKANVPVIVVHPIPLLPLVSYQCSVLRVLTGTCRARLPRSTTDAWLTGVLRVEKAAIRAATMSVSFDLTNAICDPRSCSTTREGVIQYRDERHLSIAGALMLTDDFYRAIQLHAIPRRSNLAAIQP